MSANVIALLEACAELPLVILRVSSAPVASGKAGDLAPEQTDGNGAERLETEPKADLAEAAAIGEERDEDDPTPAEDAGTIGADRQAAGRDPDLWLYRDRTVALLRRYMRLSIEVGRMPSLLGREFFRARVTSYKASTFEDSVIFVHDVERSLEELDEFQKELIAKVVLQEYSQEEAGRLLGCGRRHAVRCFAEALERVTEIFLKRELLTRLPRTKPDPGKSCQGGTKGEFRVSDSEQAKNNS